MAYDDTREFEKGTVTTGQIFGLHPIGREMTKEEMASAMAETVALRNAEEPSFLSQRRDILTRDNAKLLARKRNNQAEISRLRAENVQLTQSIRANEDGLDRLMENEG